MEHKGSEGKRFGWKEPRACTEVSGAQTGSIVHILGLKSAGDDVSVFSRMIASHVRLNRASTVHARRITRRRYERKKGGKQTITRSAGAKGSPETKTATLSSPKFESINRTERKKKRVAFFFS